MAQQPQGQFCCLGLDRYYLRLAYCQLILDYFLPDPGHWQPRPGYCRPVLGNYSHRLKPCGRDIAAPWPPIGCAPQVPAYR